MTGRLRNPNVAGWLLMAAAICVSAGLIFWLERGLTYGWDEFVWLEIAGLATDLKTLFHPYGGHLIVFPYLIWRGMLELFGASFTAFAIVQVTGLSLLAAVLYVYAKRRLGPILALAPAIAMLFLGSSWPVLMEPMIGIQFLAALLPGLAAIVMLERGDRLGDAAACVLLCLALAGFSEAVPFLLGAAVAVFLDPRWKQRLWAVAVPTIAYGIWRLWAAKYEPTGIIASNILFLPAYFADALAVFASTIFGQATLLGSGPWSSIRLGGFSISYFSAGVVFTVAEALAIGVAVWLIRRRGPIPRTLWPPLVIMIAFWVELGIVLIPGRTVSEPRYLYAGALTLLLVVIEMLRGVKTTRVTVVVAIALTGAAAVGNLARFHEGRQTLNAIQMEARADMAVIELAGKNGDESFTPNLAAPYLVPGALDLNVGPWLQVVERYGSSADSISQLRRQDEGVREEADAVAVKFLGLRLAGIAASQARDCRHVPGGGSSTETELPQGGAVIVPSRDSEVLVRRWADEFGAKLGEARGGRMVAVRVPADASSVPWRISLSAGGSVEVCALGAAQS
ncbi:MAG TPA: hypothetical protein VFI17_03280 [Solirubrobacterales bacterium]|nr:hypothetical protein [Solirubrobacterales bacterium]